MILVGILDGAGRHRRELRRSPPDVRHPRHRRRHGLRAGGGGPVRDRRGDRQPGDPPGPQHSGREDQEPDADLGRTSRRPSRRCCGERASGPCSGSCPGGGAALPPFAAYALEKKVSRHPERFGTGVIEGVASPESANNAGAQTSFIPLLTMGIPTNPLMALMIGALMIQGIQPGPRDPRAAGPLLGRGGQHVDREPDAGGHQPAAGRHVGVPAPDPLPAALPRHHPVLLHRRLRQQQQRLLRLADAGLGRAGLLLQQGGGAAGAHGPGFRPGHRCWRRISAGPCSCPAGIRWSSSSARSARRCWPWPPSCSSS